MKRLLALLGALLVFSLLVASPIGPAGDIQLPPMSTAVAVLITVAFVLLLPAVPVLLARVRVTRNRRWATAYGIASGALSSAAAAIYWWSQRHPVFQMACPPMGFTGACTVFGPRLPAEARFLLIAAGVLWFIGLALPFAGPTVPRRQKSRGGSPRCCYSLNS